MRCWHSFSGVERPPLAPNIVRHEQALADVQRRRIADSQVAIAALTLDSLACARERTQRQRPSATPHCHPPLPIAVRRSPDRQRIGLFVP